RGPGRVRGARADAERPAGHAPARADALPRALLPAALRQRQQPFAVEHQHVRQGDQQVVARQRLVFLQLGDVTGRHADTLGQVRLRPAEPLAGRPDLLAEGHRTPPRSVRRWRDSLILAGRPPAASLAFRKAEVVYYIQECREYRTFQG